MNPLEKRKKLITKNLKPKPVKKIKKARKKNMKKVLPLLPKEVQDDWAPMGPTPDIDIPDRYGNRWRTTQPWTARSASRR